MLRAPDALRRFEGYWRHEVVNHFGEQFDPTRHNRGVIPSQVHPGHWILLASVDTRSAKASHRYENRVVDRQTFSWTSQNQMTTDSARSEFITQPDRVGAHTHLFVARSKHHAYRYLGEVQVKEFRGSGPMRVTFALPEAMPDTIFAELSPES